MTKRSQRMRDDAAETWGLDRRTFLGMSALVAAGGVLSACGSSSGGSSTTPAKNAPSHLTVDQTIEPQTLDPFIVNIGSLRWLSDGVMETLYIYDDAGKITPQLTTGPVQVSSDGLTYTIPLRKDVKWSDGKPFQASDVVAVLEHSKTTGNWASHLAGYYKSSTAPDANTVVVTLLQPYGLFADKLVAIQMVPTTQIGKGDTMIGTGPYMLDTYARGSHLSLKLNPLYYGTKPKVTSLRFNFVPDAGTQVVNLRNGAADVLCGVSPTDVNSLKKASGVIVTEVAAPNDILWWLNVKRGPFVDKRVRLALAYAIDRARIRDIVYAGHAAIGEGPLGPTIQGYEKQTFYSDHADLAKAKSLLADAGKSSVDFTVISTSDNKDLFSALKSQWQAVGLNANLELTDVGAWATKWSNGQFDLSSIISQEGFAVGVTPFLLGVLHTKNPLNLGGYSNPAYDALCDKAFGTSDLAERAKYAAQANKLATEDGIWTPPAYPSFILGQRASVPAFPKAQLEVNRLPFQRLGQ